VFRVLYFCYNLTTLMGNNNKITEMVRVQKQVIMCWFIAFWSFRAK